MTIKQEIDRRAQLSLAYQDYQKGLNAYASYKVSNDAQGQDLVQDTFMKTWKYLVRGGEIDMMKSFLYHILNNLIVDEYRKKKNIPSSLDVMFEGGFEPSVDESTSMFNCLDGKDAVLLIKRLPNMYRAIVHMKYIGNLSVKEISTITGQSKNLVSVRAHRGLEKLKSLYIAHVGRLAYS